MFVKSTLPKVSGFTKSHNKLQIIKHGLVNFKVNFQQIGDISPVYFVWLCFAFF